MDPILASLTALRPPRRLTVHLLRSEPRRTQALFAHARTHPKGTTVQDVLVLLYVHLSAGDLKAIDAAPYRTDGEASEGAKEAEKEDADGAVPVLLVALQAQVYTLPASSTTVIYLAKADSTSFPLPSTLPRRAYARTLAAGWLASYLAPATRPTARVHVQLFARAQAQYLFPDSGELPGKRLLTGEKLCRWWKGTLELALAQAGLATSAGEDADGARANFVLPGLSEHEASLIVGPSRGGAVNWVYGMNGLPLMFLPPPPPPSTSSSTGAQQQQPATSAADGDDSLSETPELGELIPTFEDDPRTRFLSDLTLPPGAVPTPLASSSSGNGISKPRLAASLSDDEADAPPSSLSSATLKAQHTTLRASASQARREKAAARLRGTTEPAFWELLAFRQECSLGQTVGFFSVFAGEPLVPSPAAEKGPLQAASTSLTATSSPASAADPSPSANLAAAGLLPKQTWLRLLATVFNQSFATPRLVVRASATVHTLTRTLVGEWGALGPAVEGHVGPAEGVEQEVAAAAAAEEASAKRKAEEEPAGQAKPRPLMAVRKKKKVDAST